MVVASALELSAAQLRPSLRLPNSEIRRTKPAFHPVRRRVQGVSQNSLTDFDIADRVFNSPSHPAQRRDHIQIRKPCVSGGDRGLDQLFRPRDGLIVLDTEAEEPHVRRERGGGIEIAVVGGPAKRFAEVGEFGREPRVRLPLAWAVPQRHHFGVATGEVARVRRSSLGRLPACDEFLLCELADGLQHRKPGSTRRPIRDEQRLAHQRVE